MTTWLTADLHLGLPTSSGIAGARSTTGLIDRTLIENWNARVGRDDVVYVLSDFAYWSTRSASVYLAGLRGTKHLVVGNQDDEDVVTAPE